jgi:hypothetical protein
MPRRAGSRGSRRPRPAARVWSEVATRALGPSTSACERRAGLRRRARPRAQCAAPDERRAHKTPGSSATCARTRSLHAGVGLVHAVGSREDRSLRSTHGESRPSSRARSRTTGPASPGLFVGEQPRAVVVTSDYAERCATGTDGYPHREDERRRRRRLGALEGSAASIDEALGPQGPSLGTRRSPALEREHCGRGQRSRREASHKARSRNGGEEVSAGDCASARPSVTSPPPSRRTRGASA